jgi:predicted transposase/invertase (TIGR01784 family)
MIDLEMQVENLHNWEERSLSYLCRSFDKLHKGENYTQAGTAIHIGFLDFTPFPDAPEFYATYKLLNTKNHRIYSDKFVLSVVSLRETELATEEDKAWKIDYWARLFKATTWEEIKMIAKKDPDLLEATETLYALNGDETIRAQCQARDDYYWMQKMQQLEHERVLAELKELSSTNDALHSENNTLHSENRTLHLELDTVNSELKAANSENSILHTKMNDLIQYITELGIPLPKDE